jgi:hypothetical protein
MGGGGKQGYQNTSQDVTTTSSNVPDWMKGYYDNSLKRASAASNEPYKAYSADAADRIAGFNPAQTAVFDEVGAMTTPGQFNEASNMYSNMGNMGAAAATQGFRGANITQGMGINQAAMGANRAFGAADALGQRGQSAVDRGMSRAFDLSAPQTFGAEQAQQYTNPFQQNVTDIALRQAREESIRQGNLANLSAAGRGTAGGTRQAVMDSMRNRDTATGLSDIQMQGSMRGYENAQQQFERDQGRRMGAAQLGANIAGQGFGAMGQAGGQYGSLTGQGYSAAGQANSLLGQTGMQGLGTGAAGLSAVGTAEQNANLARLNAQNKVGSQMQDQETAKINARIEQFYEKRGYNKEQIAWMINQMKQANSGASSNATGSTYGRSPSFGTQMTGVAAAGLGSLI